MGFWNYDKIFIWNTFCIFFAGVLNDFLFTISLRYVSKEKVVLSSTAAFFNSIVSIGVLYSIISQLEGERTLVAIVVYSLGIATGTFSAMKFKFGMRNNNPSSNIIH